eukprot:scaffold919_cov153-Ochromonas_danica.AAC.25
MLLVVKSLCFKAVSDRLTSNSIPPLKSNIKMTLPVRVRFIMTNYQFLVMQKLLHILRKINRIRWLSGIVPVAAYGVGE